MFIIESCQRRSVSQNVRNRVFWQDRYRHQRRVTNKRV